MFYFPIISSGIELEESKKRILPLIENLSKEMNRFIHWNDLHTKEINTTQPLLYTDGVKNDKIVLNEDYIQLYDLINKILKQ